MASEKVCSICVSTAEDAKRMKLLPCGCDFICIDCYKSQLIESIKEGYELKCINCNCKYNSFIDIPSSKNVIPEDLEILHTLIKSLKQGMEEHASRIENIRNVAILEVERQISNAIIKEDEYLPAKPDVLLRRATKMIEMIEKGAYSDRIMDAIMKDLWIVSDAYNHPLRAGHFNIYVRTSEVHDLQNAYGNNGYMLHKIPENPFAYVLIKSHNDYLGYNSESHKCIGQISGSDIYAIVGQEKESVQIVVVPQNTHLVTRMIRILNGYPVNIGLNYGMLGPYSIRNLYARVSIEKEMPLKKRNIPLNMDKVAEALDIEEEDILVADRNGHIWIALTRSWEIIQLFSGVKETYVIPEYMRKMVYYGVKAGYFIAVSEKYIYVTDLDKNTKQFNNSAIAYDLQLFEEDNIALITDTSIGDVRLKALTA